MIDKEAIEALIAEGAKAPSVVELGNGKVIVAPHGSNLIGLRQFEPPRRIEERVALFETSSFVDYVNRFKHANTLVFVKLGVASAVFEAVIDYHSPDGLPAYCAHRARLELRLSPGFLAWTAIDRKNQTQTEFASWLEDNAKLIVDPPAAEMLELVSTLYGHKNARFNEGVRLQTGAHSVAWEEDVTVRSKTSNGTVEFPAFLTGGLPIFEGGTPYKIRARLKTQIIERSLYLRIETITLQDIIRDAILAAAKEIGDKTGIIPFVGSV